MLPSQDLADRLRDRILNLIHLWGLAPGDRLPGIRELSVEIGVDHRAVARAYRMLEAEGLVEVRGRSGVYAAQGVEQVGDLPHETERWMAGVLAQARRRGITLASLSELVGKLAATERLRCAFVESTEDHLAAYAWDLTHGYGLDVFPVDIRGAGGEALRGKLENADIVVTTPYHAVPVRAQARALGIPMVTVAVDPDAVRDAVRTLRQRLQQGPLTVIAADAMFAKRLQTMYDEVMARHDQIRFVFAGDAASVAALNPDEPVVLTRAAQARLTTPVPPVYMLHAPVLGAASVHALCTLIVQLNTRKGPA